MTGGEGLHTNTPTRSHTVPGVLLLCGFSKEQRSSRPRPQLGIFLNGRKQKCEDGFISVAALEAQSAECTSTALSLTLLPDTVSSVLMCVCEVEEGLVQERAA